MMRRVSIYAARLAGVPRYFTGEACAAGHVAERYVCSRKCVDCQRAHSAAFKQENQGRMQQYGAERYARTRDYQRERKRQWSAANKPKVIEQKNRRRAALRDAIPPDFNDFDQFVMEEAAAACKRREAAHGEPFHIDHMIPLAKGGLHTATNVQVMPPRLNVAKRDRLVLTRPGEWIFAA